MNDIVPRETSRRSAMGIMAGVGAAAMALPLLDRFGIIPSAHAQATIGLGKGESDLVYIPGKSVEAVATAEWEGLLGAAEAGVVSNRIAVGNEAIAKAPPTASRYESKTFNYPTGSLRTLTFKKGGPVYHQITFESEIFVLQGSATLTPLYGHKGDPVNLAAGDALFLPSGVIRNPNPTEDTVLLLAEVGVNGVEKPKGSIVRADAAVGGLGLQWQEGDKEFSASKPEDIAKAPANAQRSVVKRYAFDGNSIRVATFEKGPKGNVTVIKRCDVLIYIPKGHFRRTEGNQTFDLYAGDTTREKLGNPGFWIPMEDSVFIATDAPFNPATFTPGLVSR